MRLESLSLTLDFGLFVKSNVARFGTLALFDCLIFVSSSSERRGLPLCFVDGESGSWYEVADGGA